MTNEEVFASSRHGALLLRSAVTDRQQQPFLSVTNPGRALLCDSALCPYEAVPHGDMMISGNLGLWRAHAAKDLTMATASEPSLLARS